MYPVQIRSIQTDSLAEWALTINFIEKISIWNTDTGKWDKDDKDSVMKELIKYGNGNHCLEVLNMQNWPNISVYRKVFKSLAI